MKKKGIGPQGLGEKSNNGFWIGSPDVRMCECKKSVGTDKTKVCGCNKK